MNGKQLSIINSNTENFLIPPPPKKKLKLLFQLNQTEFQKNIFNSKTQRPLNLEYGLLPIEDSKIDCVFNYFQYTLDHRLGHQST